MEILDLGFSLSENMKFFYMLREKWPQLNERSNIALVPEYEVRIRALIKPKLMSIPFLYTDFKKGFKNYVKRIIGSIFNVHSLIYQGMNQYFYPIETNETVLYMLVFSHEELGVRRELVCVYEPSLDTLYIKR